MNEILEQLKKAVTQYDAEEAARWASKAVEEGIDPTQALDALTEAIREVGDSYGRGEIWLPELVGAAAAMAHATPAIEERIRAMGKKRKSLGTIVIGTVHGDIHSIGKDMVVVLSRAAGFEVIDLGVDVSAERFIETVKEREVDILGISALLTTSAAAQKEVIKALEQANLREKVKVVVGGGPIT